MSYEAEEDWLDTQIRAHLCAWAHNLIANGPPLEEEARRLDQKIFEWLHAWCRTDR